MQLVLDTNGLTVKVRNKCFWVVGKKLQRQISPHRISSIAVTADCLLSSSAIRLAAQHGVPVFWLTNTGKVAARSWSPGYGGHPSLLRAQAFWSVSSDASTWVIDLLNTKVTQQQQNLQWLANRRPGQKTLLATTTDQLQQQLAKLKALPEQPMSEIRASLLGLEGTLSRTYWRGIAAGLPAPWHFSSRSRRPAQDEFNAALNYLYGMLYTLVENAVFAAGLSPYLGVMHTDGYRRPALVFDLIEVFRPWVDRLLMELIMQKKITKNDFSVKDDGVYIGNTGKRILIPAFHAYWRQKCQFQNLLRSRKNHVYLTAGALAKTLGEEENQQV